MEYNSQSQHHVASQPLASGQLAQAELGTAQLQLVWLILLCLNLITKYNNKNNAIELVMTRLKT
jgi:hypothetical protein